MKAPSGMQYTWYATFLKTGLNSYRVHIFYSTDIKEDTITLDQEESNHCKNVLRLYAGDKVNVVDGKGMFFECSVKALDKKNVTLQIEKSFDHIGKHSYYLHIAIAPTKNIDRIEWFIEKSIEIGVDEISFIITSRTERKFINGDRFQKIAIAAIKQSVKSKLPKINVLLPFEKFINISFPSYDLFIAHLVEGEARKYFKDVVSENKTNNFLVLIGPEGDFTPNEVKLAIEKQYVPVSLGDSRLRTETAGMVACHTINLMHTVGK